MHRPSSTEKAGNSSHQASQPYFRHDSANREWEPIGLSQSVSFTGCAGWLSRMALPPASGPLARLEKAGRRLAQRLHWNITGG